MKNIYIYIVSILQKHMRLHANACTISIGPIWIENISFMCMFFLMHTEIYNLNYTNTFSLACGSGPWAYVDARLVHQKLVKASLFRVVCMYASMLQ